MRFVNSNVKISVSQFDVNRAHFGGGALHIKHSILNLIGSNFHSNTATGGGAMVLVSSSNALIKESQFDNNSATLSGGDYEKDIIKIFGVRYYSIVKNIAGALLILNSNVTINGPSAGSSHSSCATRYTDNKADWGAALWVRNGTVKIYDFLTVNGSVANEYAAIYMEDSSGEFLGTTIISNNIGSFVTLNSDIILLGRTLFVNCSPSLISLARAKEGGAITSFQSSLVFSGECMMKKNHAVNGRAILASETKLHVNANLTIENNTAMKYGGGIQLYHSELNCQRKSNLKIMGNNAAKKGGGVHAVSSLIMVMYSETLVFHYVQSRLQTQVSSISTGQLKFIENKSEKGGGMYLEANVKLHVLKSATTYHGSYRINGTDHPTTTKIQFISNKAEYGAAIFVDDDTYTATCAINERAECFVQVITPHTYGRELTFLKDDVRHLEFIQNHAGVSGSTLFGGLLDRCNLSPFTEFNASVYHGITYLKKISTTINLKSISSDPLRVCFCVNNHPNCSYHAGLKSY